MFGLFKWMFCKHVDDRFENAKNRIDLTHKNETAIPRVNHLTERYSWDDSPKQYSVYGEVVKNGSIYAATHWRGWEDAGWKLVRKDQLESYRTPDIEKTGFWITFPRTVHTFHTDCRLDGECTVKSFKIKNDKLMAVIEKFSDRSVSEIDTEYLFDAQDPQFYN